MVQFEFDAELVEQDPGRCSKVGFQGTMPANSIYHIRDWCIGMMNVPGVYSLRVRNVKEGRWVNMGPIDTRTVAEAIKPRKRKG